jgi:hypothetical protein
VLKTQIELATLDIVMEPNDETTWSLFFNLTDPVLAATQARRGLDYYKIVCDATTNTTAVKARKEFKAKLFILPVDAAEILEVSYNVINNQAQVTVS